MRKFDTIYRDRSITEIVYGGKEANTADFDVEKLIKRHKTEENGYKIYFGELHGHTDLSDGIGDIDSYFKTARDVAKLDFCAVSDHDHGGVGKTELYGEKWELTRRKVREYYQKDKFVTILAYEKDAYPVMNNIVVYYLRDDGEMIKGEREGEMTADETLRLLARDDVIVVAHTTSFLDSGTDFEHLPLELMPPLIEVYSRWGKSEYFGDRFPLRTETRGGYWRDALARGAKIGAISGSDDHAGCPGLYISPENRAIEQCLQYCWPGVCAVLAAELTREAVFDALKHRRCYATMGCRTKIDFTVNGAAMGSEITSGDRKAIYFDIDALHPLRKVTLVLNGGDAIAWNINDGSKKHSQLIFDNYFINESDYYYLRVELEDGRQCLTSPIWVSKILK